MGEGGHLPLDYYLWTSAIPLASVAAAFAWALRYSLARWRRALGGAALAALLVYLAVLWASCSGSMRLGFVLRWPEWALRYVAWVLWGASLVVWALPSGDERVSSPVGCRPGAETLTGREREVVEALVTGSTQAQVAEALAISPRRLPPIVRGRVRSSGWLPSTRSCRARSARPLFLPRWASRPPGRSRSW